MGKANDIVVPRFRNHEHNYLKESRRDTRWSIQERVRGGFEEDRGGNLPRDVLLLRGTELQWHR